MSGLTLVTGATGFIGRRLTRRLLELGRPVRVLVRRPAGLPPAIASRVELAHGDLRNGAAVEAALAGVDTVLHLAACARAWTRDIDEFRQVNVQAVARLLDAAERRGVRRFVHVSSVLTLPELAVPGGGPAYVVTKREGERLVARRGHAVIVHPARVFGPGPLSDANAVTRVIAGYMAGRFRFRLADGGVQGNYVHVDDVVEGLILAADSGRPGGHYILGSENVSLAGLLACVARVTGVRRRVVRLRPGAATAVAAAAELWGRCGGRAFLTRDWVSLFLQDQRVDCGATRAALGYRPRGLEQGVRETVRWLQRSPERVP